MRLACNGEELVIDIVDMVRRAEGRAEVRDTYDGLSVTCIKLPLETRSKELGIHVQDNPLERSYEDDVCHRSASQRSRGTFDYLWKAFRGEPRVGVDLYEHL
jgi:hypothetical protein